MKRKIRRMDYFVDELLGYGIFEYAQETEDKEEEAYVGGGKG